jgi:hypothetical protein
MMIIENSLTGAQARSLNGLKLQLELYLKNVEAKTEEFTKESLREVSDQYRVTSVELGYSHEN